MALKLVQKAIDQVMRTTNPTLRLAGYMLNMVQSRRSLHKAYESLLRKTYGSKVFTTTIPDWNDFAEALTARQPISFYKPSSDAAKLIERLALELVKRIHRQSKLPPEFQFSNSKRSQAEQAHHEVNA